MIPDEISTDIIAWTETVSITGILPTINVFLTATCFLERGTVSSKYCVVFNWKFAFNTMFALNNKKQSYKFYYMT